MFKNNKILKKIVAIVLVVPTLLMYSGGMCRVKAEEDPTSINYTCSASVPIMEALEFGMVIDIHESMPDSVEPDTEFLLENLYTNIDIVFTEDALETARGMINPLTGSVTKFNLIADNAVSTSKPDSNTVNVVEGGIDIPET